jgi:molecular chaperone GrpE
MNEHSNNNDSQEKLDNSEVSDSMNADAASQATTINLAAEVEKFKNEYLYIRAEMENLKKQSIKERSELRKYAIERFAVDLLNVLDIFDTALATPTTAENIENFRKGIDMTAHELRSVLQRHGVEELPAKGTPFDPAVHEALTSEESEAVAPGTVTQVFKKPYKLHERVIRPGQVVVAKAKS